MSDLDEKDQTTKVRPKDKVPSGDKTVVRLAGSKTAWPEPDDTPEAEIPAIIPDTDGDAEAASSETEIKPDEDTPPEGPWTAPKEPIVAPATESEPINPTEQDNTPTDTQAGSVDDLVDGDGETADNSVVEDSSFDAADLPSPDAPDPWAVSEETTGSPTIEDDDASDGDSAPAAEQSAQNSADSDVVEETSSQQNLTADDADTSDLAAENTPDELDPWATPADAIKSPTTEGEQQNEANDAAHDAQPEANGAEEDFSEDISVLRDTTDEDADPLHIAAPSGSEHSDPWATSGDTISTPATEEVQAVDESGASTDEGPVQNDTESYVEEEPSTRSDPSTVEDLPLSPVTALSPEEVDTEKAGEIAAEDANAAAEQTADTQVSEEADTLEPAEPPSEPRIEVPVQQQYASLLAALSDRVQKHPGGHDLLAVLRMLEGQTAPGAAQEGMDPKKADEPAPPRIGKSRRLMEDIVRFGQDPTGEFATSTIERATRDVDNGLILLERFLGLLGPQGALPSAYNDEAIMRGLRGDDSFPRFLDVFNNRFIQLFFRAWADARPIVQHDRPDDDRFLAYLGSSIGIGGPIYQNLDGIDDRLKLLYAGLSSSKTKSAARLKALITGVFGVNVDIDQCVGTWLHLEPDDQLSLGGLGPAGGAGQLGMDTIVGSKIYSVSDKIRIRIFTQSLEEYRKFLPPTRTKPNPWTEKLFDLIDFYLGLEIEYEIELALPKRCASSVRMDGTSSATLGHIGWLKPADEDATDIGAFDDEEDMLTDTRFRPVRRHTTVYQ